MYTRISAAAQAAIKPIWEQHVDKLLTGDTVTVAVQHIGLARIDVQDAPANLGLSAKPRPRRTVLNLYGTKDIDRLIEALQAARARMQAEQDLLNRMLAAKCEAITEAQPTADPLAGGDLQAELAAYNDARDVS